MIKKEGVAMPDSGTESKSKQTILLSRLSVILPVLAGVMADVIAFYVRDTSSGLLFSLLSMLIYIIYMGKEGFPLCQTGKSVCGTGKDTGGR